MGEYSTYTVVSEYFATGEGMTVSVMIGAWKTRDEALSQFIKEFGGYFGLGAVVHDGIYREFSSGEMLISDQLEKCLEKNIGFGYVIFKTQLHMNFS